MINFTGQTRKRVVNLGDRQRNTIGNPKNYLEKTKVQRQQREQLRQKDKAAHLIRNSVISYLAQRRRSDNFYKTWRLQQIHGLDQFNEWIAGFYCVSRWSLPFNVKDISPSLNLVLAQVRRWQIIPRTNSMLVNGLKIILSVKNSSANDVSLALQCLITVINKSDFPARYPDLIATLSRHADVNADLVNEIVLKVNDKDSSHSFFLFLTTIESLDESHLGLLREALGKETSIAAITQLLPIEKIHLLVLFLDVHQSSQFITQDYLVIGHILATVSFSVQSSTDASTMIDDEDLDEVAGGSTIVELPDDNVESLKQLYSNKFIANLINLFTGEGQNFKVALTIVSTLFHLLPAYKTKICVLITITPGSYKWFFHQLRSDILYQAIESLLRGSEDYLKYSQLEDIYKKQDSTDIVNFWKTLYTFEELYSYWLIVSNDLESFSDDRLTLEEVSEFMVFLKHACLTFIFHSNYTHTKWIYHEFEKIKDISLSVLNQLYLKNLRLKFLKNDFWTLKEISFNIDPMIQIVCEQEERRLLTDYVSEFPSRIKEKASADTLAKLEILNKLPFFLKFKDRVVIFRSLIQLDEERTPNLSFSFFLSLRVDGDIRREHVLEDAFQAFGKLGPDFKKGIRVTFYNEYGREAGIDGGGITKEFLDSVVGEGFAPNGKHSLFKETQGNQLYPNEDVFVKYVKNIDKVDQAQNLQYLRFLGAVIGKCLYEGVLIDISFAPFFLNKWCNSKNLMKNSINDLSSLDTELFLNLMKMTRMSEQELELLDLNFTVTTRIDNKEFLFDLVKGGEATKVQSSNILNYIHQMANFKLNTSLHLQSKYFLEGLFEIISSDWLKMFDFNELQMLISGSERTINIEDWKENVVYGAYTENDLTIQYFWEVVEDMTNEEKAKLLKFTTSVARAPLLGFGALNPKFGIRNSGRMLDRLPTSSTCVNLLKLPDYQDKKLVKEKLLYAINMGAGFDLS